MGTLTEIKPAGKGRGWIKGTRHPEPTAPEPAPEPGPSQPTDPEPGPAYEARLADPAAPAAYAASREALGILADRRGVLALEEHRGAISVLDGIIRAGLQSAPTDRTGKAIAAIESAVSRRSVYAARARGVAEALGVPAKLPDPPTVPDLVKLRALAEADGQARAGLARALDAARSEAESAAAGRESAADILGRPSAFAPAAPPATSRRLYYEGRARALGLAVRGLLNELSPGAVARDVPWSRSDIEHEWACIWMAMGPIQAHERYSPEAPPPERWWLDEALARLDEALARSDAAPKRLAEAEARSAEADARELAAVRKAIADAGGRNRIAEGVRDVQALQGRAHAELADLVAAVDELTAEHRRVEVQIERLTVAGISEGAAFDALIERRDDAMDRILGARRMLAAQSRELSAGIVERALAGDDEARAELAAVAGANPQCFPRGFPAAIRDAEHSRIVRAELAEALGL